MKTNAWEKLALLFNKEEDFLQKQLKNLKDTLKKCLDKRNRMTRLGAAASNLPLFKTIFILHLSFEFFVSLITIQYVIQTPYKL